MGELDFVAEKSARGSLHLFIGNLISEVFNAVTIVIVARLLTPEEMGLYGLSFVMPGLFAIISNFGLNQAMTRFLARFQSEGRWDEIKRVVKVGFVFQGGLSCLLAVLVFFGAVPLATIVLKRPDFSGILQITSLLVVAQSLLNMATSAFFGLERMDLRGIIMIVASIVKAIFAPLLVIRGFGVNGLIYGHLIGTGAAAIVAVILLVFNLRGKKGDPGHPSEGSLPDMLRFGFPLFLTTFLVQINLSYQGLLMAWFTDNVAIGNLDIANKFLSLVGLFTVPIAATIYPAFSKFSFSVQPGEMKALYRSSIRYATLIIVPATTIMAILSGPGISILFGTRYEYAPGFLSLSLLRFLAVGLGSLSVYAFLNSQGDTVTSFRLNAIALGLNVVLGTVLTWRWGIPGLLVALFVSSMAGNFLSQYVVNKKYGAALDLIHTSRVVVFSLVGAGATWQTLQYFAGFGDIVKLCVGGVVFLIACLVLAPLSRALELNDIKILRRVLKRVRFVYPIIAPFLVLEEKIIRRFTHERARAARDSLESGRPK